MIYIKRVANADVTRQIDLNKESSEVFFRFNPDTENQRFIEFINEDNNDCLSGTIKKTGHTITIVGDIFSFVKANCANGDILVFSTTRDITKYKLHIAKIGTPNFESFDKALQLFGAVNTTINNTTHLLAVSDERNQNSSCLPQIRQQIFYGAPGTGKSYTIKEQTKGMSVIRTTFHPDSDYSTFVGAYKPVMEDVDVKVVPVVVKNGISLDQNNGTYNEKRISYKFVKQAFLKSYLSAWKKYSYACDGSANADDAGKDYWQFLIIEEINRGNCAQIFGDIFQLLDREDNGFSSYPIEADSDLQMEIKNAFEEEYELATNFNVDDAVEDYESNYGETLTNDIINGRVLLLPPNMCIWATMNTSDQSLFPIDSAFKRRWDWTYIPISDERKNWVVRVNGTQYKWWSFLEKINDKIWGATQSEDKKLGYYFCKADKGSEISAEKFVGKVLFYIYNDVFKDYGFTDVIFRDSEDDKELQFHDYFKSNGKPEEEKIETFLKNLEVELATEVVNDENEGTDVPEFSFKVVLDGETIEESEYIETYLAALKKMGMEKVAEIAAGKEYSRYDCPFVSKVQFEAIKEKERFSYVEADGYQVIKGVNKKGMSGFLKLCAERLGHDITIE